MFYFSLLCFISIILSSLSYFVYQTECTKIKVHYKDSNTECVPPVVSTEVSENCEGTNCDLQFNSHDYDLTIDCEDDQNCTDLINSRFKRNLNDCKNFNISLVTNIVLLRKAISFTFTSYPSHCYDVYQVQLRKKEGNETICVDYDLLCVKHSVESGNELQFVNLDTKSYIILISPIAKIRDEVQTPIIFCTHAINITDNKVKVSENKAQHGFPTNIYLVFIPSLAFLLIITIVLYRKFKGNQPKTSQVSMEEIRDSFTEGHELLRNNVGVELLILHSTDDAIQEKIQLLKDFFENCCFFKVTLMEDAVDHILINSHEWFRSQFHYSCLKLGDCANSNKRILLVEPEKSLSTQSRVLMRTGIILTDCTDDAIQDLIEWHIISERDDLEEDMYLEALNILLTDWSRCLKDYCHLFVLEFEKQESLFSKELVPGSRYLIPQNLVSLCLNLISCEQSNHEYLRKILARSLNSHRLVEKC